MAIKNVGLLIRVERMLHAEFAEACRADDQPAVQEIREFMREYVAKRWSGAQDSLYAEKPLEHS